MREALENGHQMHLGATHVDDEEGQIIELNKLPKRKHITLAKILLLAHGMAVRGTSIDGGKFVGKTIYRYLQGGDVLRINCQVD